MLCSSSVLFLALLVALFFPISSSIPPVLHKSSFQCPIRLPLTDTSDARIVGGQKAEDFIRAHMISFHVEGCGGSLISPTWMVTAAHCLISTSSRPTYAGSNSNNGTPLTIKKVYVHPAYDFPKNDITLIELEAPAPPDAQFFAVNGDPRVPAEGEFARVAGYGYTKEYNSDNEDSELFQVDVPVVKTEDCISVFDKLDTELNGKLERSMHICAGYEDGKCDSCTQDSGGPLFVYAPDGKLVQIAIVSFGYGCARPGIPGGYVRLSKYRTWMREIGALFDEATVRKPVFLEGYEPELAQSEEEEDNSGGGSEGNEEIEGNSQNFNETESTGTGESTDGEKEDPEEPAVVGGEEDGTGQPVETDQGSSENPSTGAEDSESSPESGDEDSNFGTTGEINEAEIVAGEDGSRGTSNTVIIVSSVLAGAAVVSAVLLVIWWRRRRNSRDAQLAEAAEEAEGARV